MIEIALSVLWLGFIFLCLWFSIWTILCSRFGAPNDIEHILGDHNFPDVVMFHTYCPKESIVPLRGKLVSDVAYNLARMFKVPLLVTVGKTVPGESRMECEIYRDDIITKLRSDIAIIMGTDPAARDTYLETQEAIRICNEKGFRNPLVVGLRPHLGSRIAKFWRELTKNDKQIKFHFVAVDGPVKYYFWEFAMMLLEIPLPPQSFQRNLLLNLVGRKG